jgi:hypothetical protein
MKHEDVVENKRNGTDKAKLNCLCLGHRLFSISAAFLRAFQTPCCFSPLFFCSVAQHHSVYGSTHFETKCCLIFKRRNAILLGHIGPWKWDHYVVTKVRKFVSIAAPPPRGAETSVTVLRRWFALRHCMKCRGPVTPCTRGYVGLMTRGSLFTIINRGKCGEKQPWPILK